jgi:hypothetical protein
MRFGLKVKLNVGTANFLLQHQVGGITLDRFELLVIGGFQVLEGGAVVAVAFPRAWMRPDSRSDATSTIPKSMWFS